MPDKVISSVAEVTAEWLTSVLAGSGALAQGTVTPFDLDTSQGNWSTNARFMVKYSGKARGAVVSNRLKNGCNEDVLSSVTRLPIGAPFGFGNVGGT